MLSLSSRIFMWMAKHNVDISKPEKVTQAFGSILKSEQMKTLAEYVNITDPTSKYRIENSLYVASSIKNVVE